MLPPQVNALFRAEGHLAVHDRLLDFFLTVAAFHVFTSSATKRTSSSKVFASTFFTSWTTMPQMVL